MPEALAAGFDVLAGKAKGLKAYPLALKNLF